MGHDVQVTSTRLVLHTDINMHNTTSSYSYSLTKRFQHAWVSTRRRTMLYHESNRKQGDIIVCVVASQQMVSSHDACEKGKGKGKETDRTDAMSCLWCVARCVLTSMSLRGLMLGLDRLWLRVDLQCGCDWVWQVLIALLLDGFDAFVFLCSGS
jgi:hypothetical protein